MSAPTIRQIAYVCGYNNATVSRALSNKPLVAKKTREHILKVANEMGWKPNPLASIYMAHRRATQASKYTATLAYVMSHGNIRKFEDLPEFIKLRYKGAKARAAALGYSLELIWLHQVDNNMRILSRQLRSRGIPGLVFSLYETPETFDGFSWDSFAISVTGYDLTQPHLHRSAFYWPHGIQLALQNIHDAGYRRLALVIPDSYDSRSDYTLSSMFRYGGGKLMPGLSCMACISDQRALNYHSAIKKWLLKTRPEVIIGSYPVWQILSDMNWKVPDDVAFVTPHWSARWPQIAGIDQNPELSGANAIDLVSTQLLHNERGIPETPQLLLNEGLWMRGESLPLRNAIAPKSQVHLQLVES